MIKDGQTLLFIGDSITDCGRRAAEAPLGSGYVRLFTQLVTARQPGLKLNYINKGIGGNKVTDLRNRWQDDVMPFRPDLLSIKIGINDVHSHLSKAPGAVGPDLFAEAYDDILSRTRAAFTCDMLLIDPFYISRDRSGNSFRSQVMDLLPVYIDIVHEMSRKYQTKLIRTHDIFQEHLQLREADYFCPEPVHPYISGHLVIAEAIYNALFG